MLAIAWPRNPNGEAVHASTAARLASSLCAGIGGKAGSTTLGGLHFSYRSLRGSRAAPSWRPSVLPSGQIVVFHGYFDNAADLAAQLGAASHDPGLLYGLALERWGDEAERRIIGHYCAAVADPSDGRLRLARSPLRAPPLYYVHDDDLTAAASVPRALFAAGAEHRINEIRIADIAMRNFYDEEATAFERVSQVPIGAIVELAPGQPRAVRKWYRIEDLPFARVENDAAAIARTSELLDEAVRACITGFATPGSTLSGGLDSPQVALRALAALPEGKRLPTFTFHPESSFDGRAPRGKIGNERPLVEALAAMHGGLDPHFTANDGYEHDYRCDELFHLMGDPTGVAGTYVYHGLMAEAAKAGCDVLLLAEWGNVTFSDRGDCGFVEYLLTGQWRQLWLALTRPPVHRGSIARRFAARSLAAFLPVRMWLAIRRALKRQELLSDLARPLSTDYRRTSGADRRLERSGTIADRYQPRNRRHSRKLLFDQGDPAPFLQGLEQMYGIALRDPTSYRPFVEYCLSLPTKMFLRDGEMRWLAKQLARGVMPDGQRENRLDGWWDADGQARIRRRRDDWLAKLDSIERDERLGKMFDVDRLRSALEGLSDQTETDPEKFITAQLAVPGALLLARFINFVEGRNQS